MEFLDALAEANIRDERLGALDPFPLDPSRWETDEQGRTRAGSDVCEIMRRLIPEFPRQAAERAVSQAVARNT